MLARRPQVQALARTAASLSAARANRTGLPHPLKTGAEALSRLSLDDVRVHRNSPEPAKHNAHAFAQGNHIHLGPGQERHLPHEMWHTVQQKQGRVPATMRIQRVAINDDPSLEREADVMSVAAARTGVDAGSSPAFGPGRLAGRAVMQRVINSRDGPEASVAGIPQPVANLIASDKRYLVGSHRDFETLCDSVTAGVQIVTPMRHVIGEEHASSKFGEATRSWGWANGASFMYEGNSTHVRLGDSAGGGVRPLEDTIVKHVAQLLRDAELDGIAANVLTSYARLDGNAPVPQSAAGNILTLARQTETHFRYAVGVGQDLARYWAHASADASEATEEEREEAAAETEALNVRVAALADVQDELRAVPPDAMSHAQLLAFAKAASPGRNLGSVETLLNSCKAIARRENGQRYPAQAEKFADLNPLREHHMAQKIAAHPQLPLIVGVGAAHVPGLRQQGMADAQLHADYDAFNLATAAGLLLPNLAGSCCVVM